MGSFIPVSEPKTLFKTIPDARKLEFPHVREIPSRSMCSFREIKPWRSIKKSNFRYPSRPGDRDALGHFELAGLDVRDHPWRLRLDVSFAALRLLDAVLS